MFEFSTVKFKLRNLKNVQKIPISKPYLSKNCRSNFLKAFDSSWISSLGFFIKEFEEQFAEYIGTEFCLTTSNGTTALELAISSLDLPKSSEIIIPDLTFAAVSNAVISKGLIPVPVDVSKDDWNLSIESVKSATNSLTKAVILVHSYGVPAKDLGKIREFCSKEKLWLIEDCAEAHGAKFNSQKVGSFGDLSTFSFYGNKIITSGEGGSVLTSNKDLYMRMKKLRDHGMSESEKYFHEISGFNYRMTNPQAALLVSQLLQIDEFLEQRKIQEKIYDSRLIKLNFEKSRLGRNIDNVNWIYTLLCPPSINPSSLSEYLSKNGIDTRPIFRPITSFPYILSNQDNVISKEISRRGLSLPTFIGLNKKNIHYICDTIEEFIKLKNDNS